MQGVTIDYWLAEPPPLDLSVDLVFVYISGDISVSFNSISPEEISHFLLVAHHGRTDHHPVSLLAQIGF